MGMGQDLRRLGHTVFGRMPPTGNLRVAGDEIGLAGDHALTGAVGTAAHHGYAGHDAGLPAVALFTVPPDFLLASGADVLGG